MKREIGSATRRREFVTWHAFRIAGAYAGKDNCVSKLPIFCVRKASPIDDVYPSAMTAQIGACAAATG